MYPSNGARRVVLANCASNSLMSASVVFNRFRALSYSSRLMASFPTVCVGETQCPHSVFVGFLFIQLSTIQYRQFFKSCSLFYTRFACKIDVHDFARFSLFQFNQLIGENRAGNNQFPIKGHRFHYCCVYRKRLSSRSASSGGPACAAPLNKFSLGNAKEPLWPIPPQPFIIVFFISDSVFRAQKGYLD